MLTSRIRKLIALLILLPALMLYLFLAAWLGGRLPSAWYAQTAYYVIAGIAWIAPAAALLRWAGRKSD